MNVFPVKVLCQFTRAVRSSGYRDCNLQVICNAQFKHGTLFLAPLYITDLLEQRATRVLRSTTNNDFYVPQSRSRYGDRMFSVAGPRLWNSLPAEMKKTNCLVTFKRLLKNHLFRAVYEV